MSSTVPVGWVKVKLEDVVEVRDFEREPINSTERSERLVGKSQSDLYPYYGATGQVGWIDAYRSEGQQVLLGEDGAPFLDSNRDKAYLVNGRYWVNNHAHVLCGLEGLVENRLLAHQLNITDFHPFVSGSTRLKLTNAAMKRIPLLLPPFNEQARIVEKLEELLSDLDAGVTELKAAHRKLAQYRQSLLKAAVEGTLTAEWRIARCGYDYSPQSSSPRLPTAERLVKRGSIGSMHQGVMDSRFRGNDGQSETGADLLQRILTERRTRWETKQLAKFAEQGKAPPQGWQANYPEPVALNTRDLPALPEGWIWANMDSIVSSIETGKSFKCEERPPTNEEIGVVKVSAVSWGEYDEQESKTCRDDAWVNADLFIRHGDFLFSRANTIELVGACVIAKQVSKRIMLSDKILRFDLVDPTLDEWLLTLLRSELGRQQIELLASGNQESMRNIGQERIRQIAVPLPPRTEVFRLRNVLKQNLDAAHVQEQEVKMILKQCAAQRKNILKAAFAGELVPQDPNDEPASVLLERIRAGRATQGALGKKRGRTTRAPA